jgi:predicted small integral membrane protein
MRHVMALRVSKAVLVFAIALFYTIVVLNNIIDYGSNYEFVRHVLMMDSRRFFTELSTASWIRDARATPLASACIGCSASRNRN